MLAETDVQMIHWMDNIMNEHIILQHTVLLFSKREVKFYHR